MKRIVFLMCTVICFFQLQAQSAETQSPILFIYDASGSMWGQLDGKTKKEIAADVLASSVNNLPDSQNIGLVVYGHRAKGDCEDVEFMVGLGNNDKSKIINTVKTINPLGKTPLAKSATMAINSLRDSNMKATIILVTDGIESCNGNICDVVSKAKASGIDFKLHIVGFGLKEGETEQLKCAARAGDGNYYDANDAAGLGDVLTEATRVTVDDPEGNFSVFAMKNDQPVDASVIPKDNKELSGSRTYRDTAWVYLPPGKHVIEVRPLENTDIPATTISVEIKEGEKLHRDISFDGGTLEVETTNNGEPWDSTVRMYDRNTGKVVASVRTYGRKQQMEVPAGNYRVSYNALKLKGLETEAEVDNIEIKPNETNSISHEFKSGIVMIGVQTNGGELIDATVNFHEKESGKNVAAGRTYTSEKNNPRKFLLSPGEYEVKIVTLGAHKGNNGTFNISVKVGETVTEIYKW